MNSVGRQAQIDFVGFTVFTNFKHFADIAEWEIDKKIQREAQAQLPKRLEVRAVEYAPELEKVIYLPAEERGIRSDLGQQLLVPYLDRLIQRTPVDLVLFILPGNYPALRINNANMGLSIGFIQMPIKFVLIDARTKQEVFGKGSLPPCTGGVQNFEYRQEDMGKRLEQHREEFAALWMTCFSKKRTAFEAASGL